MNLGLVPGCKNNLAVFFGAGLTVAKEPGGFSLVLRWSQ